MRGMTVIQVVEGPDDILLYGRCFLCGEVMHPTREFDDNGDLIGLGMACGCVTDYVTEADLERLAPLPDFND